jgi:nitroreductase
MSEECLHYGDDMNVIDAVNQRISVRQFTNQEVGHDVLRQLVIDASRAPSGGNVQPWRIYVLEKEATDRLRAVIADNPEVAPPEYDIYPSGLVEPYRTNRFALGEQMYAKLGIPREDKAGRLRQMAKNMQFFDAPASMFCFIDRGMGAPQWSD